MLQKIKNFYHLFKALVAVIYFRFPSRHLYLIGVTGTDGKTTTCHLIYQILKTAGLRVGLISTVSARIGSEEIDTGFHVTTPDPLALQGILKKMVDEGLKYVVLEATSHGLDQSRLFGCRFKIGVVTNITHEHLDYHRTWQNYVKSKAKLFKGVEWAVLNRDDLSYNPLEKILKIRQIKRVSFGLKKKAEINARHIKIDASSSQFEVVDNLDQSHFQVKTSLLGKYNLYNSLAAISVVKILKIEDKLIKKSLKNFIPVAGRLQKIDEGQNFRIFIDFAHTPNGLTQTLKTLNNFKKTTPDSRLIVVFGCAGLRDHQKRPMMGKIAAQLADLVVLTAEDPRTEDVGQIIKEISHGCRLSGAQFARVPLEKNKLANSVFFKIPDRQKAIEFSLSQLAKTGDIVVICGKGHEKSMCYGQKEIPWSDEDIVRQALKLNQGTVK